MNKKIRFSLLTLLVMLCGTVFADDSQTLTFNTSAGYAQLTVTKAGTSGTGSEMVVSKGDIIVTSALGYIKDHEMTIYKSGTMTVSLGDGLAGNHITKVELNVSNYHFSPNVDGWTAGDSYQTSSKISGDNAEEFTASSNDKTSITLTNVSNGKTTVKVITVYYAADASSGGGDDNTVSNYTVDFNTAFSTTNQDFAVASNWGHIVGSNNYDNYGPYYMSYGYSADGGVDGTGALRVGAQNGYYMGSTQSQADFSDGSFDYLITPKVNGAVTLQVKRYAVTGYSSYVKIFKVDDTGATVGDELTTEITPDISEAEWSTLSLTLTEETRLAIRAQSVLLDNFTAASATILKVPAMTIASVSRIDDATTTYFDQNADGTYTVKYKVKITNTGEVDLKAGVTENYTLSVSIDGTAYGLFDVPVDVAVGETSEEFVASIVMPANSPLGWKNRYLKENLTGTTNTASLTWSQVLEYNPVAYFIKKGNEPISLGRTLSSESSIDFGMITEATTLNYVIFANNAGDLQVKSIVAPEGFTVTPAETLPYTIAAHTGIDVDVVANGEATASGNMVITYVDKNGADATVTVALTQTVINASKWMADFAGNVWPDNSVHQSSLSIVTSSYYGYDCAVKSSYSYSNKFITPKLHAISGEEFTFDAMLDYSSGNVKVYLTTDRAVIGEPVLTLTSAQLNTSSFTKQTLTAAEEGDYYVVFEIYNAFIDNLYGFEKVAVDHDIMVNSFILSGINAEDKTIQTGTKITPSFEILPVQAETAEAYTVKLYADEEVVATAESAELVAGTTKKFTFEYTPEVSETKTFVTYAAIEFTDGTVIKSAPLNLTVTCEPVFVFFNAGTTVGSAQPSSRSTAISFGNVNEANVTQNFEIYNYGTAPLTVKSITVPDGFSASVTEATVQPKERQAVDVVFSATTPGAYSGNLAIVYVDKDGADQTFELAISGKMLDQSLWYASFDNTTDAIKWPAGCVYESNISTSYHGAYNDNNYHIYVSSSTTNNKFITPKLEAAAGDVFSFDVAPNSQWYDGSVKIYLSADRENWGEPVATIEVAKAENYIGTSTFTTKEVTIENAGTYYVAIEPYYANIDNLYGLKLVNVAHDWVLASSNIPAEAMQNNPATATLNIVNRGLQDETDYTVIAHIGEETMEAAGTVTLAMEPKAVANGTQITATFQSPKPGTFPVYIEVKAGDYSVATDPVDVEFAEEVASGDVAVGESAGLDGTTPLNLYYKNSETIALYTQDKLGLSGGEKINSITWKGVTTKAHTSTLKVYYQWTDDTSITSPASTGNYDVTGMTAAIEPTSHSWTVGGSADELQDQIVVNFPTPLVYEAGKSLLILVSSSASGYASSATSVQFEKSNITGFAFLHYNDGTEGTFTGSWSAKNLPLIHLGLEVQATTFAGTVKNADGEAIEGAHIMLVSADGDNVQYMGTSDAEGAYSVNVIQANRTYTATVEADGYVPVEETVEFAGGSVEKNFVLDVPLLGKYFVNTDFASTEGWTAVKSADYADLGNGKIGEYNVRISPATVDDAHPATAYCFGFECRWSTNFSSYTQESKVALPAGTYTLTFDVENVNGATTKAAYENRFTVTVGEKVFTDQATEWMNGKSSWTKHTLVFDVVEDAKATLSFGYGTGTNNFHANNTPALYVSNLDMTFKSLADAALEALQAEIATAEALKTATRTEGLDDFNAAIETAKALLTSTDAAAINAGVEALKAAEEAFLTANLPMAEGTYYVYNPLTEKFLSRGNAYGTAAVVDDYGVAVNVAVSDLTAGKYTLSSFDNGANYGFDAWMYADAGGNNVRAYNINKVEGGVTLTNTGNNMLVYVYTNEGGDKYRVAGNAIKGDNYTDDAQTVWQFVTPAERDRMVASREAAAKTAAYEAAGFSEDDELDLGEATVVSFTTGHAWTQTVVRSEDNQPATNDNGTEMWQATGNYTQTISNLPVGLYKVTIQAFYRNGNANEDQARVASGYNTVLAYLEANGNKVQVKSWTSDKGEGNDPNNMPQAKAKFDDGKYLSEVYTCVGADGKLNLTVNNPAHIGNGWFIVGNVKYAKVEESVLAGDVSGDGEVTTNDAVAVIPFVLEQAEPTPAQFKAADVNKSNTITISDAVGIVNIALNWNSEPVDGARGMVDASNDYIVVNGSEVGLMNATTFVGFQMDVTLSEGAQFNGAQLTSRTANHQVAWNRVADRTYRVVVFSAANEAITSTEGALLQLNISGNQQVSLGKIEFTDASARAYTLGVADPTGIRGITADQLDAQIYTVGGVRSDKVRKGMNVIRQNNGKVTKRFVK